MIRRFAACLLALALGACDGPAADPSGGGGGGGGGKADERFGIEDGSREADAILRLASSLTRSELDDDVGLHPDAADGIIAFRAGADGKAGTADDRELTQLAELAAIPQVKQAAFDKLLAFADEHLLRVATFNIRWYGLNGALNNPIGSETRNDTLREFIDTQLAHRDVIAFEEIVDVKLFVAELAGDRECATYGGKPGKHQRVVVCTAPGHELALEPDDADFALETVDVNNKLRPAVHGVLRRGDRDLAHLLAVHLKADPANTAVRIEQTEHLADRLELLAGGSALPALAIGDFNTHQSGATGLAENDEDLLDAILDGPSSVELSRAVHPVQHTFRKKSGVGFRLDQVWASPAWRVLHISVPGACNAAFPEDAAAIADYFDTISDHCPMVIDYLM